MITGSKQAPVIFVYTHIYTIITLINQRFQRLQVFLCIFVYMAYTQL